MGDRREKAEKEREVATSKKNITDWLSQTLAWQTSVLVLKFNEKSSCLSIITHDTVKHVHTHVGRPSASARHITHTHRPVKLKPLKYMAIIEVSIGS